MMTAASALKTSLLINGGASIAMLGFLAALLKDNSQFVLPYEFKDSLAFFSEGVISAGIATTTTYFAQFNYQNKKKKRIGDIFRGISILLVFLSYIFFYFGIQKAYQGF